MSLHTPEKKENPESWLAVIGIGEDGLAGLGERAFCRLREAEFVFGAARHLAFIENSNLAAQRVLWATPFLDNVERVKALHGRRVAVLASGDPMFFGAGATFLRYFSLQEMEIYPHSSSFSLAAARLGWPLQEVVCCSVHGRPASRAGRYFEQGARLLVLSQDGKTPAQLAALLERRGFAASRVICLEHLGGERERVFSGRAGDFRGKIFADLNIIAIECISDMPGQDLPRFATLPDHAFTHDGQLTKQAIRAVTLAELAPKRGELLWDVGAGCGSISIEWLRLAANGRAIAIEQNSVRAGFIRQNAENLSFPELEIIEGQAPAALKGLAVPDAVFIGGGCSKPDMLETCWQALRPGGRLVANVVTLESEALLTGWSNGKDARLLKLAVAAAEPLQRFRTWRQSLAVTVLSIKKA